MNKAQKIIIIVFCFILAGILIYGAYVGGFYYRHYSGGLGKYVEFRPAELFNDIKIYLAIVFIGASVFFMAKKIK